MRIDQDLIQGEFYLKSAGYNYKRYPQHEGHRTQCPPILFWGLLSFPPLLDFALDFRGRWDSYSVS